VILETIESQRLAHLSYVLGDDSAGVCVVIDPRRDISVYLDIARRNNAEIIQILETHIHAVQASRRASCSAAASARSSIYLGA
jgi:hydroxyacylglutathione hydrolase